MLNMAQIVNKYKGVFATLKAELNQVFFDWKSCPLLFRISSGILVFGSLSAFLIVLFEFLSL